MEETLAHSNPIRVLFVCTHNSARSQMAEGWLRALGGDRFQVCSAGTQATRVNPFAIRAMAEVGIDLSSHTSDHIDTYMGQTFDYVITVCDHARETCPYFPATGKNLHWSFEDPSAATGSDEEILNRFRQIRDQIEAKIREFIQTVA